MFLDLMESQPQQLGYVHTAGQSGPNLIQEINVCTAFLFIFDDGLSLPITVLFSSMLVVN